MTPRTENKLRLAWFGPLTSDAVAKRHHVSAGGRVVRRFWESEKAAGRLPNKPRPHFIDCTPSSALAIDAAAAIEAGAAIDAAADMALDREIARGEASADDPMDPRFAAQVYGCRVPDGDPLLAALIREHGNDPRRRFDDVGSNDLSRAPSRRKLIAQRQFRDAGMRIVTKHPARFAVSLAERPAP